MKAQLIVFDSQTWQKTGDIGDNSQFYLMAEVVKEYEKDGDNLVDVRFEDGRISKGHFKSMTKAVSPS